jgi:hypothetical protein
VFAWFDHTELHHAKHEVAPPSVFKITFCSYGRVRTIGQRFKKRDWCAERQKNEGKGVPIRKCQLLQICSYSALLRIENCGLRQTRAIPIGLIYTFEINLIDHAIKP